MFTLDRENKEIKELKLAVVETLQDMMKTNDKVVALEADLGGASGFSKIQKTNPDRFINVGIAEANMVGVAAGLSVTGFVPFMHTFGPFASRRVFDQVFLSGAYAHTTMNIYGSDPGFTVGPNGGTHTTWEDVALMRTIPNAVVCDAADYVQLEWITREFVKMEGIHYVRANRKGVRNVYKEGSTFEIGKGNILKEGKDVLLIAAGQLVSDALDAAEALEKEGISVEVVDMFTIKPIDADLILKEVTGKKAVVTFENHSITGGLGSAVAEVLSDNAIGVKLKRVGVNELFGQVGTPDFLQKEFKLTADDLVKDIKEAL
ncbi:transketolase [Breznakia sp. PF5-3]|uniref:transketolase family protein n=1 Tax=unclassified Breznakia TaxID=2623764 RepID=UPI00240750B9|nr:MULTISPECIES: transketolase C-terminal domain-containing protein [unclassified Breznakia]MDF9823832.1 transketolase [Breznakia sp. PM6-1]MDF9834602.1 transketolase [Breznakia sp. PF5-3]MDF9836781.1 transketolase [Breznakia sp. PFB2-8]MDF9858770.1 transketolase [Breznakia sp. PH5-24]